MSVNPDKIEDDRYFITQLPEFKTFDQSNLTNYLSKGHIQNLHNETFLETLNMMIQFLNDAKFYAETEKKYSKAQVINAIMGGGKSTALQVIMKMIIHKSDMPLLVVFNKNKPMFDTLKAVQGYARNHKIPEAIKVFNNDNVSESDIKESLYKYKIICITQQRFRDIATGCGDFSIFSTYRTKNDDVGFFATNVKRTIIFDEMPILFNSETFDLGEHGNCLDWFDEGAKHLDSKSVSNRDIQRARLVINNIIAYEMIEVSDGDTTSLATRKLKRSIENSEQFNTLVCVLNQMEKVNLTPAAKRRFVWFNRLFMNDSIGVINRDDKKSCIYCSEFINYTRFGSILVLDGTSDITRTLYEKSGFQLKKLKNHHDYVNRLRLYACLINTSKNSRQDKEIHGRIAASLTEFKKNGEKNNLKLLALPTKYEVPTYQKHRVITDSEYSAFFEKSIKEHEESTGISLLNTTGDNDMNTYDGLALLSLPLRHPSVYKCAAIAMYGTGLDISLNQTKTKKNSIQWFTNEKAQGIYEALVMMDFSQIVHRCKIRNMSDKSEAHIFIYSDRIGWVDKLQKHYGLPNKNRQNIQIFNEKKFVLHAQNKAKNALERLNDLEQNKRHGINKIGRGLKAWFDRNWKDEEKNPIIIKQFDNIGVLIEEDVNGWLYMRLKLDN